MVSLQVTSEMNGRYILLNTFSCTARNKPSAPTLCGPRRVTSHKLGPVTYESGDIFTLFTRQRDHLYTDQIIIFPKFTRWKNWPARQGTV
ncbi:MAG: hypothetical protein R3D55_02145 [Chloroflexota bacterium]